MLFFDKYRGIGPWCLRFGVAATLWYMAWYYFKHFDDLTKLIQATRVPGPSVYLAWGVIVFLGIGGLSFFLRVWRRPIALLLVAFFIAKLFLLSWGSSEAVWKDMTLLAVSLWWLFI